MIIRHRSLWFIPPVSLLCLAAAVPPVTGQPSAQKPRLEREFQAAVAQYDSGHFPEAAQRLESLVR